jgi:hypothetical protein
MKNIYLIFFTLLLNYSAISQVWVDSGAVWHYDYWNIGEMGFDKFIYANDTVIEGKNCQKITQTWFRFTYNQYDSLVLLGEMPLNDNFTYVSGDTVFYWNDGKFFVLYNFGASIGDEWIISTSNDGFGECDDTSRIVVTNKGIIDLNGTSYRYISVQPTSNSSMGLKGTYVERFGNIDLQDRPFQCLFPGPVQCDSLSGIVEWSYFNFKCFEDSSFTLYNPSFEDCEYYLNLLGTDEFISNEIACYPNPSKNILRVDYNFNSDVFVEIFTAQGMLIRSFIMNKNSNLIDISYLNKGLYMLKFQSGHDENYTSKIIKE